jgi:hypothetical protein
VFEEPEVLPALLDGVVDRTGLAGFRIGKARAALEINDELQRLGDGIEVAGNDLSWRSQAQRLSEEIFNSHGWILHDTGLARPAFKASYRRASGHRKVAHKNLPLRRAWENHNVRLVTHSFLDCAKKVLPCMTGVTLAHAVNLFSNLSKRIIHLHRNPGGGGDRLGAHEGISLGLEEGDFSNRREVVIKFFHQQGVVFPANAAGDLTIAESMDQVGPLDPVENRDAVGDIEVGESVLIALGATADESVRPAVECMEGG